MRKEHLDPKESLPISQETMVLSYEWWIRLKPLWTKFARETVLCGYDREDLVQECYLQLLKNLQKFDATKGIPFESYYKIQLYGWRANENRKKREVLTLDNLTPNEEGKGTARELTDTSSAFEGEVINKLLCNTILEKLQEMEGEQQYIIIAHYLHNQPIRQIAEEMGLKYKAVEYKKQKALKKLRKILPF